MREPTVKDYSCGVLEAMRHRIYIARYIVRKRILAKKIAAERAKDN